MPKSYDANHDPSTGRFCAGNKASPGRPTKPKEERYVELMRETVTEADFVAVVQKMVEQAKKGDKWARSHLFDYVLGPAAQTFNVKSMTSADWQELFTSPPADDQST